jgi:hypothetical protein
MEKAVHKAVDRIASFLEEQRQVVLRRQIRECEIYLGNKIWNEGEDFRREQLERALDALRNASLRMTRAKASLVEALYS